MDLQSIAHELGIGLGCSYHGVERREVIKMAATQDALRDPAAEGFGRLCAGFAGEIWKNAGQDLQAEVSRRLAASPSWGTVQQDMAVTSMQAAVSYADKIKSAADNPATGIADLVSLGAKGVPMGAGLLKWLYTLAGLGGLVSGSVGWSMDREPDTDQQRDMVTDEAKTKQLQRAALQLRASRGY